MKKQSGFSLFDVMLAVVVIVVASIGVYALFDRGTSANSLTNAENQLVQMAGVYSDLSAADLTNGVTSAAILETLFYNSQRLSEQYFNVADGEVSEMYNAFGALEFPSPDPTPYGFTVKVPLGCVSSTVAQGFYNAVRDQYACDSTGSTSCTIADEACVENITLYYDTTG